MKLTKREKVLLIGAFIIIAAVIFVMYFYLPLTKEIKNLQLQSEDITLQLQKAKTTQGLIKELEAKLVKEQDKKSTESNNLLKVWDQAELLVFVENMIDKYGMKDSVDFYDTVSVENITAGDIGIKIKTDYNGLQKIWEGFENAKYLNTLVSFDISEAEADGSNLQADTAAEADIISEAGAFNLGNEAAKALPDKADAGDKELEVNMNLRFYSTNSLGGYPADYDFMDGKYGKKDLFE